MEVPRRIRLLRSSIALAAVGLVLSGSAQASLTGMHIVPNAATVSSEVRPALAFDPVAPPQPEKGKVVAVTLEAVRAKLEIAPGEFQEVWTFNRQVLAPTIRMHQGDTLRITLLNKDPELDHGLDFHAGQMDSGTYHKANHCSAGPSPCTSQTACSAP